MKSQPTDHFVISDEVLSQEINGETVLLDLESESYFGLNEIGTRIWQLLESEHCVAETLDTLSDEYDVSSEQLENVKRPNHPMSPTNHLPKKESQ